VSRAILRLSPRLSYWTGTMDPEEAFSVPEAGGAALLRATTAGEKRGRFFRSSSSTRAGADSFTPAWWMTGAHLQTVWGRVTRPRRRLAYRREILETPDGDELVVDHCDGAQQSPRLVILHGLEGSSYSVYVQGLLASALAAGLSGTAMNFRSCARDPRELARAIPNRRPRLYHSGETEDFDFLLATLSAREPGVPLVAVGASLGGNVLLKWLGEHPAQTVIRAAAAISTPFDLAAGARRLEKGMGRLYTESFLRTLRPKALEAARRFPEAGARIDVARVARSKTFWEFDDAANAPLHGFAGADDYYRRASCLPLLGRITTPVLCISAQDDPFLPAECLERVRREASPAVEHLWTLRGGHIGFVEGAVPWKARYWAETRAIAFLAGHAFASGRAVTGPRKGTALAVDPTEEGPR